MINTNKILWEITYYNIIKLSLNVHYNFVKKSDNAYLIKKKPILSFGENNFT